MRVKKKGSKVYGGSFTSAEKKTLDIEIQKELAIHMKNIGHEIDAMILLVLHEEFGFGPVRLRRFYDSFKLRMDDLTNTYVMNECGDLSWLCRHKLKEYGIDVTEWSKEEE